MSNNTINTTSDQPAQERSIEQDFNQLDVLFSKARTDESAYFERHDLTRSGASLSDENFTKLVLNSLPSRPNRGKGRSIVFDLIGLMLGLLAAYWFFDANQVAQTALAWVPETLSLTVNNLASVLLGGLGLSWLAWWTADKAVN